MSKPFYAERSTSHSLMLPLIVLALGAATSAQAQNYTQPSAYYVSFNWAGYLMPYQTNNTNDGIPATSVSAQWNVPAADCKADLPNTAKALAIWVGLGGFFGPSGGGEAPLEQLGMLCDENNTLTIRPFYEFRPTKPPVYVTLDDGIFIKTIKPSDTIQAKVSFAGLSAGQQSFNFLIYDTTNGGKWQNKYPLLLPNNTPALSQEYTLSSAEWIAERPKQTTGPQFPLIPNLQVAFESASATINGVPTFVGNLPRVPFLQIDLCNAAATPTTYAYPMGYGPGWSISIPRPLAKGYSVSLPDGKWPGTPYGCKGN
jgi:hypothetical protein